MWQDILKTAIVGTERNALALSVRNNALGDMLSKLDANAREASLLSAAAAIALYERAGQLPAKDSQALPTPAEADESQCCSERSAQHLSMMLNGEFKDVLPEWLAALVQSRKKVPPETLPLLLDVGLGDTKLRDSIIRVIGRRGLWLARQKSEWKYAIGEIDKATWETDSHAARLAFIKELRGQNAAAALNLLRSNWQENTPAQRAEFIEALHPQLSPADEEFLEFALDDRSTIVRQSASKLLACLPESAFVQRMIGRVLPLVVFHKKPRNKIEIELTLPAERPEAMIRDGITAKAQHANIGEKTWWLMLMLEAVPLAFWVKHSGLSAQELMQATKKSEWGEMLIESWLKGAVRLGKLDLIEALMPLKKNDYSLNTTLRELPAAQSDALLVALIKGQQRVKFIEVIGYLLMSHLSQWSRELTSVILAEWELLIPDLSKRMSYYIPNFAVYLNAELIPQALTKLSASRADDTITTKMIDTLQFRAAMLSDLEPKSNE